MEKQTKIIQSYNIQFKIKEKRQDNLAAALLKTFLISCLIGVVYGLSNFLFTANVILMPIIGVAAVSYVYNTNYYEENVNPVVRLILGFFCSLQIIIAFLVCEMAYSQVPLYPANIRIILSEYLRYTIENPAKQAIPIFLLAISFVYGALQDYTFRLQMLLRKSLMKKLGRYYYKKEGHMVSIYIIDPMDYDENEKDRLIAYVTEGCYIELQKKSLKAFYLPKLNLEEAEISLPNDGIAVIAGNEYYKLDLGSMGAWQKYEAPCALIMDGKQNVEVIQIEV